MKLPVGIQNFEGLIQDGYIYVDKSRQIYDLSHGGKYIFLSRPRRFGKSLLLSTMKAYFQGRKDLFKGLAIEKLESEWIEYPVLYIDLNTGKYDETPASLEERLDTILMAWEKEYACTDSVAYSSAIRFEHVIRSAVEKTGRRVVILIDEYDKPMVQSIDNEPLLNAHRSTLKAFYSVMKSCDQYIKFAFLTGVTKFSKVSIFSDLNNLTDISMDERFIDCCGLTEKEIRENLDPCVGALAVSEGITKEECYGELKKMYDGYHFRLNSEGLYNPFSVLSALNSKSIDYFWFATGTPTILVKLLQLNDYDLNDIAVAPVFSSRLEGVENLKDNPIPLMYQSGYLTIKAYNKMFRSFTLDYPNEEVRDGFLNFLLPHYTPAKNENGAKYIQDFTNDILSGRVESFLQTLKIFFDEGDYRVAGKAELYFQNAMYVIFRLIGLYVDVETATSRGRMDISIKTPDYIYIIELKLDGSPEAALAQIEEKGYADKFSSDPRKLFKIGINFSSETRSIESYLVV